MERECQKHGSLADGWGGAPRVFDHERNMQCKLEVGLLAPPETGSPRMAYSCNTHDTLQVPSTMAYSCNWEPTRVYFLARERLSVRILTDVNVESGLRSLSRRPWRLQESLQKAFSTEKINARGLGVPETAAHQGKAGFLALKKCLSSLLALPV